MTNIEEQFYKTFEIEPRQMYIFTKDYEATITSGITDRILLELMCILCKEADTYYEPFYGTTFEDLKDNILCTCMEVYDALTTGEEIKQQVQALFKGEE